MSMNKQGNNKPVFNLGLISEYRDELFGIAIIAIVIFHYCADFNGAIDIIKEKIYTEPFLLKTCILKDYFKWISSVGVEIFVFLSSNLKITGNTAYSTNINRMNHIVCTPSVKKL